MGQLEAAAPGGASGLCSFCPGPVDPASQHGDPPAEKAGVLQCTLSAWLGGAECGDSVARSSSVLAWRVMSVWGLPLSILEPLTWAEKLEPGVLGS